MNTHFLHSLFYLRKQLVLFSLLIACFIRPLSAQFLVNYPTAANPVTVCYSSSLLTVSVTAVSASTSNQVKIILPSGINYVAGSVTTVTESSISNLNTPLFTLPNMTAGQVVTFTILREATCAARTLALSGGIFKDVIQVTGSAGTFTENSTLNSYQVNFASLSLSSPALISSGAVGTTYTRTLTLTNGGSGCTNTAYFTITPLTGVVVQQLEVLNGATVVGTFASPSGTITIPSSMLPGGDLCNGESITLRETIRLNACPASAEQYTAAWGCSSASICQSATASGAITMATGVPNVVPTSESIITKFEFCTGGVGSATFTNNGTGGAAGTAFNVTLRLGASYQGAQPGFSNSFGIRNVYIGGTAATCGTQLLTQTGGVAVNTGTVNNAPAVISLSQLTSAFNGLTDEDGDGQFDDLRVGSTFTICFQFYTIQQTVCVVDYRSAQTQYQTTFTNQCGAATQSLLYYSSTTYSGINAVAGNGFNIDFTNNTPVLVTAPTDASVGVPFPINVSSSLRSSLTDASFGCDNGFVRLELIVPSGFTLQPGTTFNWNGSGTVLSATQPNATTIIIDGQRTNVNYGSQLYNFDFNLSYACPAASSTFTYTVYWACDGAGACLNKLGCGSFSVTPHCTTCSTGGLTLTSSDFERQTTGFTNAAGTTRVPKSLLTATQLNIGTSCDIFRGTFPGVYYTHTGSPNGYFELQYNLVGGSKVLDFVPGTAVFSINGGPACATTIVPTESTSGGKHTITFNLNSCGTAGLVNGSTVNLSADFRVLINSSLPTPPTQLAGMRTRYYSLNASAAQVTCDTWAGEIRIHRSVSGMYTFNNNEVIYQGCQNPTWTTGLYYGTLADIYPNEIRPALNLESFVVTLNNGDVFDPTFTPVLNVYGISQPGQTYPIAYPLPASNYVVSGNTVTFTNDGSWPLSDLGYNNGSTGAAAALQYRLKNGCASQSVGTVNLTWNWKNYTAAGDLSCAQSVTQTTPITVRHTLGNITLTNLTGTVQGLAPEHYWDVRIGNNSGQTTPFIWLALPDNPIGSGIDITRVEYPVGNVIAPTTYTNGKWYKLSTAGLASGVNADVRVYFNYNGCNTQSITALAGWNCSGYPSDPTTSTCTAATSTLSVVPELSEVQLTIVTQPSSATNLCTPLSFELEMSSAQAANLINPRFEMTMPVGMSVSGNFQAEYPRGSGNWQTIANAGTGLNYVYNVSTHPAYPVGGLPGTVASPGLPNRKIGLRFTATTSCGYSPGSNLNFRVYADRLCGQAATGSGSALTSAEINIIGVSTYSEIPTLTVSVPSVSCAQQATIDVDFTIVGGTSAASDTAYFYLPAGISYVTGSLACTSANPAYCPTYVGSVAGSAGTTIIKFKYPAGMPSATTVHYAINVLVSSTAACGINPILFQNRVIKPPLSCSGTPCSNVTAVIAGTATLNLNVVKPTVSFAASGNSACQATTGITVNSSVTFSGLNLPAGATTLIEYYCADALGNATGSLLGSATITGSVLDGTTVNITSTIANGCSLVNGIVAILRANAGCACANTSMPIPLTACPEICNNSIDDDGDGFTDCLDGECSISSINGNNTASISASGATSYCIGNSVTLTAAPNLLGLTYAWSAGTPTNLISTTASAAGNYVVTVTRTSTGCSATANQTTTYSVSPIVNITGSNETCINQPVTLTANATTSSGSITGYTWNNGGGNIPITNFNLNATTVYAVTATNSNNCTASASYSVSITNPANKAALATSSTNQTVLPFLCENAGWTYYASPSNTTQFLFAINWNPDGGILANATQKAAAQVTIDVAQPLSSPLYGATYINGATPAQGYYQAVNNATSEATFVMRRYWNVNVGGGSLPEPVSIKFYFDPVEYNAIITAANQWSLAHGGYIEGAKWFKTIAATDGLNNSFNPNTDISPVQVEPSGWVMALAPTNIGVENSTTYAQFDNIASFSGGTAAVGVGNGTVLPIELLSFTGQKDNGKSLLRWATETEHNCHYFDVERSQTGIDFETIGRVNGHGTSNERHDYNFTDNAPYTGDNYYRLRQVDYDGSVYYTRLINLNFDELNQDFTVHLYPNPVENLMTIDYRNALNNDLRLEAYDIQGTLLDQAVLNSGANSGSIQFNTSAWAAGIYIIKITNGEHQTVHRIVKSW